MDMFEFACWCIIIFIAGFIFVELLLAIIFQTPRELDLPKNPCAWCQRESGEQPQAGQSHGICERHMRDELTSAGIDKVYCPKDCQGDCK